MHVQCRCLEYAARASSIRVTRYAREYTLLIKDAMKCFWAGQQSANRSGSRLRTQLSSAFAAFWRILRRIIIKSLEVVSSVLDGAHRRNASLGLLTERR